MNMTALLYGKIFPAMTYLMADGSTSAGSTSGTGQITEITFDSIMGFVKGAVSALGAFLALWGAVGVGLSIKDNQGMSMDANAGRLIGGLVIVAVAQLFTLVNLTY